MDGDGNMPRPHNDPTNQPSVVSISPAMRQDRRKASKRALCHQTHGTKNRRQTQGRRHENRNNQVPRHHLRSRHAQRPQHHQHHQHHQHRQRHQHPHTEKSTIPPLDGPLGAPALPVVTTSDPQVVDQWIKEHIPSHHSHHSNQTNDAPPSIIGFDIESIAKTPWFPERNQLPDGPATIQLATPNSALIAQLLHFRNDTGTFATAADVPSSLREVIKNPRIIKVGVGIGDDALELFRWSEPPAHKSCNGNQQPHSKTNAPGATNVRWDMRSRFEIGFLLSNAGLKDHLCGIREIALQLLGVTIHKPKTLSMSNWATERLTPRQIEYAARDAWVSAAVMEKLGKLRRDNPGVFSPKSLLERDFLKLQMSVGEMEGVLPEYKRLKKALNKLVKKMKVDESDGRMDPEREKKRRELQSVIDSYHLEPPIFEKEDFVLPFY